MLPDPYMVPKIVPSSSEAGTNAILTSLTANSSIRHLATSSAGGVRFMKTSHNVVGSGAAIRDRHLVRLEALGVEDSVEIPSIVGSLYCVADLPRNPLFVGEAELWRHLTGLLYGASGSVAYNGDATEFFDRWVAGES